MVTRTLLLALLLPALAPAQPASRPASRPAGPVVVLGASLSAGHGHHLRLAALLAAAGEGRPVLDLSTTAFFLNPEATGRRQVAQARRRAPGLAVGVDFLFWYLYGYHPTVLSRQELFARGLAELASLGAVPLVVGDLPDMRGADPKLLPPLAIPPPREIEQANAALREWAARRPGTLVVPLSRWTAELKGGITLPPEEGVDPPGAAPVRIEAGQGLLWDRLHPTRAAMAGLGVLLGREMRRGFGKEAVWTFSLPLARVAAELGPEEEKG